MKRQSTKNTNFTPAEKLRFARKLRKSQTPAETIIWEKVRRKALGCKFYRQAIVFGWIADFYCPAFNLVVEIDGSSHIGKEYKDAFRDNRMGERGITVLRFSNKEVFNCLDAVVKAIKKRLR